MCGMSKYEERAKQPKKDDNVTIIYSFGLNGESSFESEMMKRLPNAELFGFDYSVDDVGPPLDWKLLRVVFTISYPHFGTNFEANIWLPLQFGPQIQPNARSRSHFMKVGLAGSDSPSKSPPFYSFQSLMAHHKHDYIDILKIDVEASEWVSLGAYFDYLKAQKIKTMPIGQIMIELHLGDPGEEKVDAPTILNW